MEKLLQSSSDSNQHNVVIVPGSDVVIKFVENDITQHNVDAIVNVTNKAFSLDSGGISEVIKEKGFKKY